MKRREFILATLAVSVAGTGCAARFGARAPDPLRLDLAGYTLREISADGVSVKVRAYEGLPYVSRPVEPEYQVLNLYVPDAYFSGGRVGAYTASTAPIFLPNAVGGYMPAKPGTLASPMFGPPGQAALPSASALALMQGFVVAAPGARGRTLKSAEGVWTGKAPAAIADIKAAVRWLRHNAGHMPGNVERIVSNGTSAGGALSALLGASGNHPDYEADLERMGAAAQRDDVFAVSAYCPITNLAHADEAYEWQFEGIREYRNVAVSMLDFRAQRKEVVGQLTDEQVALSAEMRKNFIAYVNALGLRTADNRRLELTAEGGGSFRDYIADQLLASAQRAQDGGLDLSSTPWLTVRGGRAVSVDFGEYARTVGRMKAQPAFDGFALETGENQLFGDAVNDRRHFTAFSAQHSQVKGALRADERTVRAMDAMQQIRDVRSTVASHWRIRHGTLDRDTSLAVPTLLAAAAYARSTSVDLALPWARPHSGDYDLDELFAWIKARAA